MVVVVVVVVVVVAFPSLAFWGSRSICSFFFVSVPCLDISTLVDWAQNTKSLPLSRGGEYATVH